MKWKCRNCRKYNIGGSTTIGGSLNIGYTVVTNTNYISPLSSETVYCNCPVGTKVLGGG
jgi:hypothetical protein